MPQLEAEVYLPILMLLQVNRFRINREEKREIITDKGGTRTKLVGRYGQFKGNPGRDEKEL